MKYWLITACAVTVMLNPALAQQSTQELPSAPSATVQQQRQAATPPAQPTTAQTTPAAPTQQQAAPPTAKTTPSAANGAAQDAKPANFPAVSVPPAQQQPGQQQADDQEPTAPLQTIIKSVNEVNLVFTVTDKHGRFVKDLKRDDIRVLDDNKPPASVVNFRSETDLPLRVGLLIDASNSIRDRFKFEQEAAIEFLNQIVRPKSDQAFVIGFDSTAEVTQDYTDSSEKLAKGVRVLRPGGGTALFDAIYFACRDKLANASAGGPTRRAIIMLSDGEDNQSRVTREEAIEMAQRAEVIIYAISTNISGVKTRGDKVLERFAETTGGRTFFPFKIQDVADAFNDIQSELRSQYAIAYKPADFAADGRFRSIQLESTRNKNLRVRARKGYYAPKQ